MTEAYSNHITHICPQNEWQEALQKGYYSAQSLQAEGFIHCSRPEQVIETANRFYTSVSDLLLLWIDTKLVEPDILWEKADGELFPHIYGRLNLDAVVAVQQLSPDADGNFHSL